MNALTFHKSNQNRIMSVVALVLVVGISIIHAQEITIPQGVRLLENKSFDDGERIRQEILELYKHLRLTDVLDGLDLIGLQDISLMDKEIRPLWRDSQGFSHRIVGFALTVRHVPTDLRVGQNSFADLEGYRNFKREQYARAPDAWMKVARPGDVGVIDAHGIPECGFIGSK